MLVDWRERPISAGAMARLLERWRKWQRVIGIAGFAYGDVMDRPLPVFRPRRYSEKIQWRKLFDANPLLATFCDKLLARDYIAARLGADVLPRLLWAGDDPDALPLATLPRPYIVKCTHGSGFNLVVRTAADIDDDGMRRQLKAWLAVDFAALTLQPAYRTDRPMIMVEPLLTDEGGYLPEYKFFMFDGRARMVMHRLRFGDEQAERSQRFYDLDWRPIPIRIGGVPYGADSDPPAELDRMRDMAERLAAGCDHVRVDFFVSDGRTYVGEITVYHRNGFIRFEDDSHDLMIGDWWRLRWPASRAVLAMLTRSAPASKGAARKWRKRARRREARAARNAGAPPT